MENHVPLLREELKTQTARCSGASPALRSPRSASRPSRTSRPWHQSSGRRSIKANEGPGRPRAFLRLMHSWIVCMVAMSGLLGTRIGEAANPGPSLTSLDDPHGDSDAFGFGDEDLVGAEAADCPRPEEPLQDIAHDALVSYIPAKKFIGSKQGWVFTLRN
eukprot:11578587-Karenia_brevis.AAC.1